MWSIVLVAAASTGFASDTVNEQNVHSEEAQVVQVAWGRDEKDAVLPEFWLVSNRPIDADVVLSMRASFSDKLVEWSVGPVAVAQGTSQRVDVTVPSDAFWADEQQNFFTDLEMTVRCYDAEGTLLATYGGPPLKLLRDESSPSLQMLDPEQAQVAAPHGYAHDAPVGADDIIEQEREEGIVNVEFGPGL